MKMFVGIVPTEDIYNTVINIQKPFGDNRLEPHITLRPPVEVADLEQWLHAIEKICFNVNPFNIELPATGFFGKKVLFIEAISDELTRLHNQIVKAIEPFEKKDPKEQKHERFNGHVTLGRQWCGFTPEHFREMKRLADAYLSKTPVSFSVSSIRVYHKPGHEKRYKPFKDIPLGKNVPS